MTITDQLAEEAKALIGDRAEVKFPDYADVPSFMESGTVWASSLNAR